MNFANNFMLLLKRFPLDNKFVSLQLQLEIYIEPVQEKPIRVALHSTQRYSELFFKTHDLSCCHAYTRPPYNLVQLCCCQKYLFLSHIFDVIMPNRNITTATELSAQLNSALYEIKHKLIFYCLKELWLALPSSGTTQILPLYAVCAARYKAVNNISANLLMLIARRFHLSIISDREIKFSGNDNIAAAVIPSHTMSILVFFENVDAKSTYLSHSFYECSFRPSRSYHFFCKVTKIIIANKAIYNCLFHER